VKLIDLTGRRIGRLRVVRRAPDAISPSASRRMWVCVCDCGTELVIGGTQLLNGQTHSCGCLRREVSRNRSLRHGQSKSKVYQVWRNMRSRCLRPTHRHYLQNGGRGIKVCERWHVFENFLADMGERPSPRMVILRRDPDGDFTPDNCYWGVLKKGHPPVGFEGKTQSLLQHAVDHGLPYWTVYSRVHRQGWPLEAALTTPPKGTP
jgi:hypothetical protein